MGKRPGRVLKTQTVAVEMNFHLHDKISLFSRK